MASSTVNISRLISVTEIIKREYLKKLRETHSNRLSGLHQYNKIGFLEDLGLGHNTEVQDDDATSPVSKALMGKNQCVELVWPGEKMLISLLCQV